MKREKRERKKKKKSIDCLCSSFRFSHMKFEWNRNFTNFISTKISLWQHDKWSHNKIWNSQKLWWNQQIQLLINKHHRLFYRWIITIVVVVGNKANLIGKCQFISPFVSHLIWKVRMMTDVYCCKILQHHLWSNEREKERKEKKSEMQIGDSNSILRSFISFSFNPSAAVVRCVRNYNKF